jgi:hypothetical protein
MIECAADKNASSARPLPRQQCRNNEDHAANSRAEKHAEKHRIKYCNIDRFHGCDALRRWQSPRALITNVENAKKTPPISPQSIVDKKVNAKRNLFVITTHASCVSARLFAEALLQVVSFGSE